jgi:hypothetical protein
VALDLMSGFWSNSSGNATGNDDCESEHAKSEFHNW